MAHAHKQPSFVISPHTNIFGRTGATRPLSFVYRCRWRLLSPGAAWWDMHSFKVNLLSLSDMNNVQGKQARECAAWLSSLLCFVPFFFLPLGILSSSLSSLVSQSSVQSDKHSYTISKKVEVVEWHRSHGKNVSIISRQFIIDRKGVREWDAKFDTLRRLHYGSSRLKRKICNGRPVFSEELDDTLFEFLECERSLESDCMNLIFCSDLRKLLVGLTIMTVR